MMTITSCEYRNQNMMYHFVVSRRSNPTARHPHLYEFGVHFLLLIGNDSEIDSLRNKGL